jgi:hypothetical protein
MKYNEYLSEVKKTWKRKDNLDDLNTSRLNLIGAVGNIALNLDSKDELRQSLADVIASLVKISEIANLSDVIDNRFEDNWEVPIVLSVNEPAIIGDLLERSLTILRCSTHNEEIIGAISESLDLVIYFMSWRNLDLEALQYASLGKLQKDA